MWGIFIGTAVLAFLFGVFSLSLCRASKRADEDSCRELLEYLQKKERQGNKVGDTSVE